MKRDVEQAYGIKLDPNSVIWTLLVPYAAWLIERFKVRANGRRSYEDAYGIRYKGELMPFAETCLFRHAFNAAGRGPKGMKFSKADLRMERGICCGRKAETNEFVFATADGTFTSRTAKRLPADLGRADGELLKSIVGTPWNRQCEAPRGRPRQTQPTGFVVLPSSGVPSVQPPGPAEAPEVQTAPEAEIQTEHHSGGAMPEKPAGESESSPEAIVSSPQPQLQSQQTPGQQAASSGGLASDQLLPAEPQSPDTRTSAMRQLEQQWLEETGLSPKRLRKSDDMVNATGIADGLHGAEPDDDPELEDVSDLQTKEDVKDIIAGKSRELDNMDLFGLYDVVSKDNALGKRVIKGRWVVVKRGQSEWRCRWVCKDFKVMDPNADGLFTPSSHPSTGNVIDAYAVKTDKPSRIADAMNAYWHVDETEEVYIEAPQELIDRMVAEGQPGDVVLRMDKKEAVWQARRQRCIC